MDGLDEGPLAFQRAMADTSSSQHVGEASRNGTFVYISGWLI